MSLLFDLLNIADHVRYTITKYSYNTFEILIEVEKWYYLFVDEPRDMF